MLLQIRAQQLNLTVYQIKSHLIQLTDAQAWALVDSDNIVKSYVS